MGPTVIRLVAVLVGWPFVPVNVDNTNDMTSKGNIVDDNGSKISLLRADVVPVELGKKPEGKLDVVAPGVKGDEQFGGYVVSGKKEEVGSVGGREVLVSKTRLIKIEVTLGVETVVTLLWTAAAANMLNTMNEAPTRNILNRTLRAKVGP